MTYHTPEKIPAGDTMRAPRGPALLYINDDAQPTFCILDRADMDYMPQRDRALCRALVRKVLTELDEIEAQ